MTKKRGNIVKSKKIKFSNKWISALIVIGIFVLVATGIYAILTLIDIGHPQEEIIVSIDSIDDCDVTLKDAISYGWLKGIATPSSSNCLLESEFPKVYHLASEVIVEINGVQLTLQDAINQNYFKGTGTISSALTPLPSIGHFATKVEVTIGGTPKILQNVLSELKNTCAANYNQDCPSGDAACINLGTIQCDGSCSGSYKDSGISCGTNMVCDGAGNCVVSDECIPGETRTKDCDYLDALCRNYHDVTDTCDSFGFWINPPCNSYTNAVKGIFCENRGCYRYECDDSGNCDRRTCTVNGCTCDWDWRCCSDRCSWGECKAKKIICTELYNTGFLDEERYRIDVRYAPSYFSPEALRGYHAWGIPVVEFMRKNPTSAIHILPLAKSFIDEVAYRVGEREKGNEIGDLFLDKAVPLFERIGILINAPNVELFDENLLQSKIDLTNSVFNNILENDDKNDELVKNYFTKERVKVVFSEALEKSDGSEMKFAHALLENLEKEVEEIESMVEALDN